MNAKQWPMAVSVILDVIDVIESERDNCHPHISPFDCHDDCVCLITRIQYHIKIFER